MDSLIFPFGDDVCSPLTYGRSEIKFSYGMWFISCGSWHLHIHGMDGTCELTSDCSGKSAFLLFSLPFSAFAFPCFDSVPCSEAGHPLNTDSAAGAVGKDSRRCICGAKSTQSESAVMMQVIYKCHGDAINEVLATATAQGSVRSQCFQSH